MDRGYGGFPWGADHRNIIIGGESACVIISRRRASPFPDHLPWFPSRFGLICVLSLHGLLFKPSCILFSFFKSFLPIFLKILFFISYTSCLNLHHSTYAHIYLFLTNTWRIPRANSMSINIKYINLLSKCYPLKDGRLIEQLAYALIHYENVCLSL